MNLVSGEITMTLSSDHQILSSASFMWIFLAKYGGDSPPSTAEMLQ